MTVDICIKAARAELTAAHGDLIDTLSKEKSRRRAPLVRQLHEVRRMLSPDYRYTSQAGQDAVVDRVLKGKRGGVFVDIGGYDGFTGSNTLFLEVFRGWKGVLVEPVPRQLERAQAVRRCPCLGLAVATTEGDAEFIEVKSGLTQMSGLSETYDGSLLDKVRADPRHKESVLKVRTKTLSSIIDHAGTRRPDFVSLDIEGAELTVLSEFPFETHRPLIWSVENNSGTSEISAIMRTAGYDLIEFCGPDDIYLDRRVD